MFIIVGKLLSRPMRLHMSSTNTGFLYNHQKTFMSIKHTSYIVGSICLGYTVDRLVDNYMSKKSCRIIITTLPKI